MTTITITPTRHESLTHVTRCQNPTHYAAAMVNSNKVFATGKCGSGKSTHAVRCLLYSITGKILFVAPTDDMVHRTVHSLRECLGELHHRVEVTSARALISQSFKQLTGTVARYRVVIVDDVHLDVPELHYAVEFVRHYARAYILVSASPGGSPGRHLSGTTVVRDSRVDYQYVRDCSVTSLDGTAWDPRAWGSAATVVVFPTTAAVMRKLRQYYRAKHVPTTVYDGKTTRAFMGVTFVARENAFGATINAQVMIDTGWVVATVDDDGLVRTSPRRCDAVEEYQRHGRIGRLGHGLIIASDVKPSKVSTSPLYSRRMARIQDRLGVVGGIPKVRSPVPRIFCGNYGLPANHLDLADVRDQSVVRCLEPLRVKTARQLYDHDPVAYSSALVYAMIARNGVRIPCISERVRDVSRVLGVRYTVAPVQQLRDRRVSTSRGFRFDLDGKPVDFRTLDDERIVTTFCSVMAWLRRLEKRDVSQESGRINGLLGDGKVSGRWDHCYLHGTCVGQAKNPGPRSSTFLSTVTRWVKTTVAGAVFVPTQTLSRYRYTSFDDCQADRARWQSDNNDVCGRMLVVYYTTTELSRVFELDGDRHTYVAMVGLDIVPTAAIDWDRVQSKRFGYVNYDLKEVHRMVLHQRQPVTSVEFDTIRKETGYAAVRGGRAMGNTARRWASSHGMPVVYMLPSSGEPFGHVDAESFSMAKVAENRESTLRDISAHVLLVFVEEDTNAITYIENSGVTRRYEAVKYSVYPLMELPEPEVVTAHYVDGRGCRWSYQAYWIDGEPVPDETAQRAYNTERRKTRVRASPPPKRVEPGLGFIPVEQCSPDICVPLGTRYYQPDRVVTQSMLGDGGKEECRDGEAKNPGPVDVEDQISATQPVIDCFVSNVEIWTNTSMVLHAMTIAGALLYRVGEAANPGPSDGQDTGQETVDPTATQQTTVTSSTTTTGSRIRRAGWRSGTVPEALLSTAVSTEVDGTTYSDREVDRITAIFQSYGEAFIVNFLMFVIRSDGSDKAAMTATFDHDGKKVKFSRVFNEVADELHSKVFHPRRFAKSIAKFLVSLYEQHEDFESIRTGEDPLLSFGKYKSIYFLSWCQHLAPDHMLASIRKYNAGKVLTQTEVVDLKSMNIEDVTQIGGSSRTHTSKGVGNK